MSSRNKSGKRKWFATELGELFFQKLQEIGFSSPIDPSFTCRVPVKPRRPTTRKGRKDMSLPTQVIQGQIKGSLDKKTKAESYRIR